MEYIDERHEEQSPLISVIVPIYRVEPYLAKCVDSIVHQTYENLEILLVDDGSPDACPAMSDEYALEDARILVIHKTNGGLSDARNYGIELADGEWLSFVDSDDWIEPDMYSTLLELAKRHGARIAVGGVNDELEADGTVSVLKSTFDGSEKVTVRTAFEAMRAYFQGSWSAWDKIYQREFFGDLRFPKGEINEDEAIVLQLLEPCRRVVYTNHVLYHYIHRQNSITTSSFTPKKMIFYDHCCKNTQWIRKHHPELVPYALARQRGSILTLSWMIALADRSYIPLIVPMIEDLRRNAAEYRVIPCGKRDRFFCFLLRKFPFTVYRAVLRTGLRLKGHRLGQV